MRRLSSRWGWWYVLPLAALGCVLNARGVFRSSAHAMPPSPTVAEGPHEASKDFDHPHHIAHVLIISEDGMRADAVAKLHLHWHDLLRKRGSSTVHAKTIRDAS